MKHHSSMLNMFNVLGAVILICSISMSTVTAKKFFSGDHNMLKIGAGSPASISELPFAVQLEIHGIVRAKCAGSLISPSHVLTVAHCTRFMPQVLSESSESDFIGYAITVIAGEAMKGGRGATSQRRQVLEILRYPDFNAIINANDLAILVLSDPFKLNEYVNVIKLAEDEQEFIGDGIIAGWGDLADTEHNHTSNEEFRRAQVPLLNGRICSARYSNNTKRFDDQFMICAGGNLTDTCTGDSGGPLVCTDKNSEQYLCGLTSWGDGCDILNSPGVYTRVSAYSEWIQNALQTFNSTITSNANQIYCGSGAYLPRTSVCNGIKECSSGRDEAGCGTCESGQFQCATISDKCVPLGFVCDGDDDCGDGSDELGCGDCNHTEYRCPSSRCVSPICNVQFDRCFIAQCLSLDVYASCSGERDIECAKRLDGQCIIGKWRCRGTRTSLLGPRPISFTRPRTTCSWTEFQCPGTTRCIPFRYVCDSDNDCGDWSDEAGCTTTKATMTTSPTTPRPTTSSTEATTTTATTQPLPTTTTASTMLSNLRLVSANDPPNNSDGAIEASDSKTQAQTAGGGGGGASVVLTILNVIQLCVLLAILGLMYHIWREYRQRQPQTQDGSKYSAMHVTASAPPNCMEQNGTTTTYAANGAVV